MARAVRRIVVIQGHPDRGGHYCHALGDAYVAGARGAGHHLEIVNLASMELPFLRSRDDQRHGPRPACVISAQRLLLDSDHLVLIYPIWNGGAPAMLRAFMEHAFRPAFAFPFVDPQLQLSFMAAIRARKALSGRSARVITTMQMPSLVYRLLFRPHQEANALWLAGARPVKQSAIGQVEAVDGRARERWLRRVAEWGERAC